MTARRSRSLLPLLLLVLSFGTSPLWGRAAEDFFHAAAHRYVEGKASEALLEAEEGLRRHPGDTRLQALARHLREERERRQQNREGGSQQQDESGEKSEDESGENSGDPQAGERDRDDQRQGDENAPREDGQQPDRDRSRSGDGERGNEDDGREAQRGDGRRPGGMSREEAERLLNSFADDEKQEQAGRRRAVAPASGMEQTW